MTTVQTIWVACRALLRNKMRSFLTTLGIVIGVAAVISMSAIGAGARARVSSMFESMGANILIVFSGSSRQGGMRGGQGSQPTLTWADLDRIREDIPDVRYAAPMMGIGAQVMAEGQNWQTQVRGTTADYFGIRNWPAASGEIFGDVDEDADNAARAAVLSGEHRLAEYHVAFLPVKAGDRRLELLDPTGFQEIVVLIREKEGVTPLNDLMDGLADDLFPRQ